MSHSFCNLKIKRRLFHGLEKIPCCFCGKLTWRNAKKRNLATLEHIVPKQMGGNSELDNLAISCYSCNMERGVADFMQFLRFKRGITDEIPNGSCLTLIKRNKKIIYNLMIQEQAWLRKQYKKEMAMKNESEQASSNASNC